MIEPQYITDFKKQLSNTIKPLVLFIDKSQIKSFLERVNHSSPLAEIFGIEIGQEQLRQGVLKAYSLPVFEKNIRFQIEQYTICDGWTNTWTTEDENGNTIPVTYETYEEAKSDLEELFKDVKDAVKSGDMEEEEDPSQYRIVQVPHKEGVQLIAN